MHWLSPTYNNKIVVSKVFRLKSDVRTGATLHDGDYPTHPVVLENAMHERERCARCSGELEKEYSRRLVAQHRIGGQLDSTRLELDVLKTREVWSRPGSRLASFF